jgi:hypothetical protein
MVKLKCKHCGDEREVYLFGAHDLIWLICLCFATGIVIGRALCGII